MTRAQVLLVAVLAIPLAGCVLDGKPKTVAAAPAAPKPTAPPTPPEPLSIPQTQVELPAQQTWEPGALPPAPQEAPPPQAQTKPAPAPKPQKPNGTVPSPKPATDTQTAAPEPAAEQATEPVRAPIHEIMPDAEKNRLRDEAHGHQEETRKLLREAKPKTANQKRAKDEINQFLKQSQEAENAGDMRMADQLAERAHILAKELESGK
jgi:hypothetical protein